MIIQLTLCPMSHVQIVLGVVECLRMSYDYSTNLMSHVSYPNSPRTSQKVV